MAWIQYLLLFAGVTLVGVGYVVRGRNRMLGGAVALFLAGALPAVIDISRVALAENARLDAEHDRPR